MTRTPLAHTAQQAKFYPDAASYDPVVAHDRIAELEAENARLRGRTVPLEVTDAMVEAAAKALYDLRPTSSKWADRTRAVRGAYASEARTALTAALAGTTTTPTPTGAPT